MGRNYLVLPHMALAESGEAALGQPEATLTDSDAERSGGRSLVGPESSEFKGGESPAGQQLPQDLKNYRLRQVVIETCAPFRRGPG